MIRALIVDDQTIVRQGLRMLLSTIQDIEISGEAKDGVEAVEKAIQLQPDLIIMDTMMPLKDGIAATESIVGMFPAMLVIILSIEGGDEIRRRTASAGAFAFSEKKAGQSALLQEIHRAVELIRSRNA